MTKQSTTWEVKNVKKHNLDDEYTNLTLTNNKGSFTFKIDNLRHFVQDLDKKANYKGL